MSVAVFCLLGIFGLLPIGLNSNKTAIEQTAAAGVATSIASDLWQSPTVATSPRFSFSRTSTAMQTVFIGEDGGKVAAAADARFRVSVWCNPPSIATYKTATSARIMITWPPLADANAASTPSKYSGSFETVISLDRN